MVIPGSAFRHRPPLRASKALCQDDKAMQRPQRSCHRTAPVGSPTQCDPSFQAEDNCRYPRRALPSHCTIELRRPVGCAVLCQRSGLLDPKFPATLQCLGHGLRKAPRHSAFASEIELLADFVAEPSVRWQEAMTG